MVVVTLGTGTVGTVTTLPDPEPCEFDEEFATPPATAVPLEPVWTPDGRAVVPDASCPPAVVDVAPAGPVAAAWAAAGVAWWGPLTA